MEQLIFDFLYLWGEIISLPHRRPVPAVHSSRKAELVFLNMNFTFSTLSFWKGKSAQ